MQNTWNFRSSKKCCESTYLLGCFIHKHFQIMNLILNTIRHTKGGVRCSHEGLGWRVFIRLQQVCTNYDFGYLNLILSIMRTPPLSLKLSITRRIRSKAGGMLPWVVSRSSSDFSKPAPNAAAAAAEHHQTIIHIETRNSNPCSENTKPNCWICIGTHNPNTWNLQN